MTLALAAGGRALIGKTPDLDPGSFLPPPRDSELLQRDQLEEIGVASIDRALWNLRSILKAIGPEQETRILVALQAASDPDVALGGLERLLCGSLGFPPALLEPDRIERLIQLLGAGDPMVDLAAGNLLEVTTAGFSGPQWEHLQTPVIGGADETARARALTRWHRRELLRIVCCELSGTLDVEQTGIALSDLADLTVRSALDVLGGSELPMAIVALGKWGGRELNFSSDIDLYFIREDDTAAGPCETVARGILRLLSGYAGSTPIYRTDLRLRPGGTTGPLVPTLSQARNEFRTVAGTWERIVHIRSRPVHDETRNLSGLLAEVEQFVFERPFDLEEIRRLQGWKEVLENSPAGQDVKELKVGWGGIRDVEYLVQFLQLLHGQVHVSIRGGNTYHALRRLDAIGALTASEAARVLDGYRFLRSVEHHRMLQHQRQSFSLPDDPAQFRALARSLGFDDSEGLQEALDKKRQRIRTILESLFHDLFSEYGDEQAGEVHVILAFEPEPEVIDRVFGKYSFRDPRKAYRLLRRLAFPRQPALRSPRARHYLAALFPVLLEAIRSSPDPDQVALMFVDCVETLGAPAIFYQQLTERPETCQIFVDLFGRSRYLSELLLNHPGILDEIVDRVRTVRRATEQSLLEELRSSVAGIDEEAEFLRRIHEFRALHFVHIGILDLSGRLPLERVLLSLSAVARTVLRVIDEKAFERTEEQFGKLVTPNGQSPSRHCLLALGRLGGDEMGYSSDIDMILVHDGFGTTEDGHDARDFWSEHLKHVTEMLTHSGTGGPLYNVDLRLRPDGAGGTLVTRFDEFKEYLLGDRSQLWEHQALIRLSPATGDEALGQEVLDWVRQNLGRGVESSQVLDELRQMHERRREAGRGDGIDFRTGSGGLLDIEFLVQSQILLHQGELPEIFQPRTIQAIEALEKHSLLDASDSTALRNAYQFLRMLENRLSMMHRSSVKAVSEEDESLHDLALRIGFEGSMAGTPEERLRVEIDHHTTLVRDIFRSHHPRD
jgi:glutamate-ammonia-ligase adenylyltransferase